MSYSGNYAAPSAPPAPPPQIPEASSSKRSLERPRQGLSEENEWERQVALCRSSRKEVEFWMEFTNDTKKTIDLIWKDYNGEESVAKQNLLPGDKLERIAYFKHSFIVREVATRKLQLFKFGRNWSVVFEGHNFGRYDSSY